MTVTIKIKIYLTLIILGIIMMTPSQTFALLKVRSFSLNTILHFASGFSENFIKMTGTDETVNLKESKNEKTLSILNVGFKNLAQSSNDFETGIQTTDDQNDKNQVAEVIGQVLAYPNPFVQANGAQIGYRLSKNMDLEIHFYDMLANLVIKRALNSGYIGAKKGYNKIDINQASFDGQFLSAGVYFFVLVSDGKVLPNGSGKVAVLP